MENGELEISLEVPINYEIVSWILGFGSAAEVIQPDSLRDRIMAELHTSAMRYRKSTEPRKAFTKKISATLS